MNERRSIIIPAQVKKVEDFYKRDFDQVIDGEEKNRIFSPAYLRMQSLFRENGIVLPPDMLSRLIILSNSDFSEFLQQMNGMSDPNGYAVTDIRSRYVFINHESLLHEAEHLGEDPELTLVYAGMHELGHSAGFTELWTSNSQAENIELAQVMVKQHGFTFRPDMQKHPRLQQLYEGFMDYIARQSLFKNQRSLITYGYKDELDIVDLLVNRIGSALLFQTVYNAIPFNQFKIVMDQQFGENSLSILDQTMKKDADEYLDAVIFGFEDHLPYENTKALFR